MENLKAQLNSNFERSGVPWEIEGQCVVSRYANGAYACMGKLKPRHPHNDEVRTVDFRYYSANHLLIVDYDREAFERYFIG